MIAALRSLGIVHDIACGERRLVEERLDDGRRGLAAPYFVDLFAGSLEIGVAIHRRPP